MATSWVDQITGNGETVAYKAPCRVATTADVMLSGLLTVDGVALAADDRVLVKDQATASQNGVYIASTGIWRRARDFDSNRDVTKGTRLTVTDGSTNAGREYVLTSANPINVGTSAIIIAQSLSSDAGGSAIAAAASAAAALASEQSTAADAIATAADRVQTGLDRAATGADRTQTGLDAIATAADRVQTGLDASASGSAASVATAAKNDAVAAKNAAEAAAASVDLPDIMPGDGGKSLVVKEDESGYEFGDGGDVAGDTHAASSKTTPVNADELPLVDSDASWGLKKLTWSNVKAALKAYFDTLYAAAGNYLPLTGGTMGASAVIAFAAEVGEKIRLYGSGYGMGVEASTLNLWGGPTLRYRNGSSSGTILAEIVGAATQAQHLTRKDYVDAAVAGKAGLYTGSTQDETNFPVGHIISCGLTPLPARNASVVPRLATAATTYLDAGAVGAVLSGTWRSRGNATSGVSILQRTA